MMNILIHDTDSFYREGMSELMKSLVQRKIYGEVNFCYELNAKTLTCADILIVYIHNGEQFICWADVCLDKSLKVIVITNDGLSNESYTLPWCFANAIFINRSQSLEKISEKISELLRQTRSARGELFKSCHNCHNKVLNEDQKNTLSHFVECGNAGDVSSKIALNVKTIYSRMAQVKKSYNLKSHCDLYYFASSMKKRGLL